VADDSNQLHIFLATGEKAGITPRAKKNFDVAQASHQLAVS